MNPNLSCLRAKQARLGVVLSKGALRTAFILLSVILFGLGWWLFWQRSGVSWLVIGLAVWPILPLVWYEWWLKNIPTAKSSEKVEDFIDSALLGRLSPNASPAQLAQIVMTMPAGAFFAIRFGIGPNFLNQLSSQNSADSDAIWRDAAQLYRQLATPNLSAAVLLAALVKALPNRDQLLAQLQLDYQDVLKGVSWYHHINQLLAKLKDKKAGGGIGRDLGFGYTPHLAQFAQNISIINSGFAREIEGHQEVVTQLISQLSSGGRQNAVLVGRMGVGKTTIVGSFAERLIIGSKNVPSELKFCQVMALDPSTLIANAGGKGQLEALVTQLLTEAYLAKNIIIFLDNAELFFGSGTGAVDLRNVLLPVLEGGGLRMILGMDEQEFLKLSQGAPNLTGQLNRIAVAPMGQNDTFLVCEDKIVEFEYRFKVRYMYQAIKTAYRLGGRYSPNNLSMPGQALLALESAARFASDGLVTGTSVEQSLEQTYGVKVSSANKTDERDKLLNLEQLLHKRMVNQSRAVGVVANALRRARSGVRNQNRPIGAFLFLGPTGVGKTELAKALASVYFGGEARMVRLDLNEYGQAASAERLIASGANDPFSLTAQIAKQPFSVVLLDEIEKAHPSVLNALLQMLDEGVLRDVNNRDVSFRDAIVIATSNAGADKIRAYIQAGQSLDQFEEEFINQLIDSGQFKPEFLNRFDEITIFRPLTVDELAQVVELILAGVNKTLKSQGVQVKVADDAKRRLVQAGNDPRLGARPLRRIVQKTVENIVAKRLLKGEVAAGATTLISLTDIEQALKE